MEPVQVVLQWLKEEGYQETFNKLVEESGKEYIEGALADHMLRQTFGELQLTQNTKALRGLLNEPRMTLTDEEKVLNLEASPVAMITTPRGLIVSFNDKSIRVFTPGLEQIQIVKPDIPTILGFQLHENKLYFGTMGGHVGVMDHETLEVLNQVQLKTSHIISIRLTGNLLWAASNTGTLGVINTEDFTIMDTFEHGTQIAAMCTVNDGVIYACHNDNVFHFRSASNPQKATYHLMNPKELDVHGFGIRDMREGTANRQTFVALTDQNRAIVYRLEPSAKDVEILTNLTHMTSDGLTQPQIIWPRGSIAISTCDDLRVVGIDVGINKVAFELRRWHKAPRCLAVIGDWLFVGAFDKTLKAFRLVDVE